jgi:hypothetical protein
MGCGASQAVDSVIVGGYSPPEPADRLVLKFAAETDIGGPSKKENQDVSFEHLGFMAEPSRYLFGVMDGHGQVPARTGATAEHGTMLAGRSQGGSVLREGSCPLGEWLSPVY